jgi:hypothetical protein
MSPVIHHNLYDICVKGIGLTRDSKYHLRVLDQVKICNDVPVLVNPLVKQELEEKNIQLPRQDDTCTEIQLLLGADVIGDILTGRIIKLRSGLTAIETVLGWTIMGKLKDTTSVITSICLKNSVIDDLWALEKLGITDPVEDKTNEKIYEEAMENFNNTLQVDDEGRYHVKLPWLEGHPQLLTNKELAVKRLDNLSKKLVSTNKYEDYDQVLKTWQSEGVIEECQLDDTGHYLPHHAVIKESSDTTKIRPVFDASAKDKRYNSLNSCLNKGPNMIELLTSVLINFRLGMIGVTADIKKAFLQIALDEEDRNSLKFIWWENYEQRLMKAYRHCRVVFGVSPSPFLLNAVIKHHLSTQVEQYPETVNKLQSGFYVDDCITSVDSVEELNKFIEEAQLVMKKAKFELRGWAHSHGSDDSHNTHVLGILWDVKEDKLSSNTETMADYQDEVITKRKMLSITQKLFDPLGVLAPVTILAKMWLQEVCRLKLNWDEGIPEDIARKFQSWLLQFKEHDGFQYDRKLFTQVEGRHNYSLHCFTDASKDAYATCIYIRSEVDGRVCVRLVQCKNRVTPMKKVSIPRLELLAALIGSRLVHNLRKILQTDDQNVYYWTDSMVVMYWIKSTNKEQWNNFVGNRLKEICNNSRPEQWRHVPGESNPADLPSRGCSLDVLNKSSWLNGPDWLYLTQDKWPNSKIDCSQVELSSERRKTVTCTAVINTDSLLSEEFSKFNKYEQNVRVIAWVYRFINNCRRKKDKEDRLMTELQTEEVSKAEKFLIKLIQTENFSKEQGNRVNSLHPVKDEDGIIRVKTRLILGAEPDSFTFPILLPDNSVHVNKLIQQLHSRNMHAGVSTTMVLVRDKYWLLKCRKTVKQVINNCKTCRKMKVKKVETSPAPLPSNRITMKRAFEVTGVDLAGPLVAKDMKKMWIVIYTCAVYRAVHLELVTSLSTDAFIMSLRRFIARRGRVTTIYSDNGTNFVGTANALKTLDWQEIVNFSSVRRIEWRFNPPTASWWGGWWERIVRVVKDLLKRNLGKSCLYMEEIYTVLCDCESVINSRPLTYISDDNNDFSPLTPGMFIQCLTDVEVPDLDSIDARHMQKRYRNMQKIRENIRTRFRNEYLSQLIMKGKTASGSLEAGQVVLVQADNVKRVNWPLARVIQLLPGRDDTVRVVKVKLASGKEVLRPVQRIYPLEMSSAPTTSQSTEREDVREEMTASVDEEKKGTTRSGRTVKPRDVLNL